VTGQEGGFEEHAGSRTAIELSPKTKHVAAEQWAVRVAQIVEEERGTKWLAEH
jgi:hypothetical protein